MSLWVKWEKHFFFLILNSVLRKEAEIMKQMQWQKVGCKDMFNFFIIIITKSKYLHSPFFFQVCRCFLTDVSKLLFVLSNRVGCARLELHRLELQSLVHLRRDGRDTRIAGFTCDQVHKLELEGDPDRFGKQEDAAARLRQQVQVELHGVWPFRQQVSTVSSLLSPPAGPVMFQPSLEPRPFPLPRPTRSSEPRLLLNSGDTSKLERRSCLSPLTFDPRPSQTFCKHGRDYHSFIMRTSVTRQDFL